MWTIGERTRSSGYHRLFLIYWYLIRFAIADKDGGIEYWATDDLGMDVVTRLAHIERIWPIEDYHRGLRQHCGVERSQSRGHHAQRNHIGLAIRALLRLAWHRYTTQVSWAGANARIIREAVRVYVARPLYTLPGPRNYY